MFSCGPSHHERAAALAAAPTEHHHSGSAGHHDHHQVASGHEHHHEASASPDQAGDHHQLDKLSKFKCSACSTCCTTAALPASLLTFEAVPPAHFAVPALPETAVAFLTGGPERPPRPILA